MFSSTSLLTSLLLAISIASNPAAATPIVEVREPSLTLPFVRSLNLTGGTIASQDRQRAAHLKSAGQNHSWGLKKRAASSFSVTNTAVTYVASVGVGSPPTTYTLLIDTGSSNTWVGAGKKYVKTSTSVDTGHKFSVSYGSGSVSGEEYTDTVTLDSALVITKQSIGVATSSSGFSGVDGILGIGPVDLTEGTVSGVSTVPTVSDNLKSQGTIPTEVVGVSYNPSNTEPNTNGELTFGAVDTTKYTGTLTYTSLTSTSPASAYWGINESITYGTSTSILSTTAGIVDTGTTLILLASNGYNAYRTATGATLDGATGLLKISTTNYANLKSLFFTIGGVKWELTKNGQTWPRALNTYIGGTSGSIYLVVNNLGTPSGEGLDFINGYTFLERFYSVFDTTNKRFGIATTANTDSTIN